MKRFKTAVNTVMSDIQDIKSRKAYEELEKIETGYTERVLERIGLFDIKRNDIKVLIQRNIITEEQFKNVQLLFQNTITYENNKDIKKLKKALELFESILLKYNNLFVYTKEEKTYKLGTTSIKINFKELKDYLEKNNDIIITIENLNTFSNILSNFIFKFINFIILRKSNIITIGEKFSDFKLIYKCIIIILGINNKIINFIAIINIINNNNDKSKKIINKSMTSQSLNDSIFNNDEIMNIINKKIYMINNEFDLEFKINNVKNIYKKAYDNYKNIKKYLDIDFSSIQIKRIRRTFELLYNLILRNISLFIHNTNTTNNLTKEILDSKFKEVINKLITMEDKEVSINSIIELSKKISKISDIIDPYIRCNDHINLKYNIKIGDFEKGYKDYKNYLRYIKIIKYTKHLLYGFGYSNYNDIKYKSIMTPKSSNKDYTLKFKKNKDISLKNFSNLSPEPLSAIKSSPKDVTYFGEKKIYL